MSVGLLNKFRHLRSLRQDMHLPEQQGIMHLEALEFGAQAFKRPNISLANFVTVIVDLFN